MIAVHLSVSAKEYSVVAAKVMATAIKKMKYLIIFRFDESLSNIYVPISG